MCSWFRKSTKTAPFQFGKLTQPERVELSAHLTRIGTPIDENNLPKGVLSSEGQEIDATAVAKDAFKLVSGLFESPAVLTTLSKAPLVGVMTDSLGVNGISGQLRTSRKCYLSITAGTFLKGLIALYRMEGTRQVSIGGAVLQAQSILFPGETFAIPHEVDARYDAMRCAMYGTLAVFCHELAHLFRGHCAFLRQTWGLDSYLEHSNAPSGEIQVRRMMEIDADDTSGSFLAQLLFADRRTDGKLLESPTDLERFRQLVRGVCALYTGFEANQIYMSGAARAFLVSTRLAMDCGFPHPEAARFAMAAVEQNAADMLSSTLVHRRQFDGLNEEVRELLNTTLPQIASCAQQWIACRPWDTPST